MRVRDNGLKNENTVLVGTQKMAAIIVIIIVLYLEVLLINGSGIDFAIGNGKINHGVNCIF